MVYDLKIADRLKVYGITTVKIFGILEELNKKITNEGCKRKDGTNFQLQNK